MSSNIIIPPDSSGLVGYVPPPGLPHFNTTRFLVPRQRLAAGIVICVGGLSGFRMQPMALALLRDFIYLGNADEMVWWKSLQAIQRVQISDMSDFSIPIPTPDGGSVNLFMSKAKGLDIVMPADFGGTISITLAMLHPNHAYEWYGWIEEARIDFQKRARGSGAR